MSREEVSQVPVEVRIPGDVTGDEGEGWHSDTSRGEDTQ